MSNLDGRVQQECGGHHKEHKGIANTIPFDVLCFIFEYYAPLETTEYPLETLLLVCRAWTYAATHHTRIWSTFAIHLRNPGDLRLWKTRVVRRLARCGPTALFDIAITEEPTTPLIYIKKFDDDDSSSISICDGILSSLAGPSYELVCRWRQLKANTFLNIASNIGLYLTLPTPKLEVLELSNAKITDRFIPHAPLLKTFRSHENRIVSFPRKTSLTNVFELEFDREDFRNMEMARMVKVVKMTACNLTGMATALSGTFPVLEELILRWPGGALPHSYDTLVAPVLKRLVVFAYRSTDINWVLKTPGIPLKQLEEAKFVSLSWFHNRDDGLQLLTRSLLSLLRAMSGIKTLELEGPLIPSLVVKLFDAHGDTLFQSHSLALKINGQSFQLEHGDDRAIGMENLRQTYTPVVDGNWTDSDELGLARFEISRIT